MLKLQIGAKVMLTIHTATQDCLINGQTGNIMRIKFTQGRVCKVYVKIFDEQAGLKAMRYLCSSYLGSQSSLLPIHTCEIQI